MPQDKNTQLPADSEPALETGTTDMQRPASGQEAQAAQAADQQQKTPVAA